MSRYPAWLNDLGFLQNLISTKDDLSQADRFFLVASSIPKNHEERMKKDELMHQVLESGFPDVELCELARITSMAFQRGFPKMALWFLFRLMNHEKDKDIKFKIYHQHGFQAFAHILSQSDSSWLCCNRCRWFLCFSRVS